MKIILIGFMGAGKTSVAKILEHLLNYKVAEMDELVLQKAQCADMQQLIEEKGEIAIREQEIAIARDLRSVENTIVSTGGGVVMNKIILDYLKEKKSWTIFLHAPFEILQARVAQDPHIRPLFQNMEQARVLYDFRLSLYQHYADLKIETAEKTPAQIANFLSATRKFS